MRLKALKAITFMLILTLLFTIVPSCRPVYAAESYLAVIPKVLHSGHTEELSIALFKGESLISGNVEVSLLKDGAEIFSIEKRITGKGIVRLEVPDIEDGDYEIQVKTAGFEDKAAVRVESSFLTFWRPINLSTNRDRLLT